MGLLFKTIRIIDLNLRFGLADDGPNSWTHRRRAYPELFKAWPGIPAICR